MKPLSVTQPEISIVVISICPDNLAANLQHVVDAAEALTSAELILVCQGYTPDLSRLQVQLPVTVVGAPRLLGISRARNCGADEARGKFISFLDDDVRPQPDFFERCVHELNTRPELVGVLGALLVSGNGRSKLFSKFRRPASPRLGTYELWRLANGNTCVFRRSGLRFDPRLGVGTVFGSFEDADHLLAIARLGTLAYLPDAVLFHPDMSEAEIFNPVRMCQYGRGLGGCFRKNPSWPGAVFFAGSLVNNLLRFLRLRPYPSMRARWSHVLAARAKIAGWLQWEQDALACMDEPGELTVRHHDVVFQGQSRSSGQS